MCGVMGQSCKEILVYASACTWNFKKFLVIH